MSDQEDSKSGLDFNALAFEYATGTLRGDERRMFEDVLKDDRKLGESVAFWEDRLMSRHTTTVDRQPSQLTWDAIDQHLNPSENSTEEKSSLWSRYFSFQRLAFSFVFAWAVIMSTWVINNPTGNGYPNADYVAVLTNADDDALLTALTSKDGDTLWLRWEDELVKDASSVQLWAQSRRDGQIRPLHVFDQNNINQVALDETALRLVQDSEFLILTLEEEGGSSIDEPSDIVLAKGVCVRLT